MQIIYRILLANPFSALVCEIPDTLQKPGFAAKKLHAS